MQVLHPTNFVPFISYEKQFGVYDCSIQLNLPGGVVLTWLRNSLLDFFDNNAFVTLWVSSILLEASQFHRGPTVPDDQLLYAMEAISTYHDKNHALNDSILIFWPQTYNSTTREWSAYPTNLGKLLDPTVGFLDKIVRILSKLGFRKLARTVEGRL